VALRLHNGTEVTIRPIRPDDKPLLAAAVERLSPRTARMRFLAPKTRLTRAEQRYLTEIDFVDHYALVAVHADAPRRLAGVARWVRSAEDHGAAELAIVVADELQGQGLGRALGMALADAARERGVARFTATMLPDNDAAHALFDAITARLTELAEAA